MTVTAWTVADFVDQLVAQVAARPTLTALDPVPAVLAYYPSDNEGITDGVFVGFMADDSPEKRFVDGPAQRHEETNTVTGFVRVERVGSGRVVALAARDRALFLISEIDDEIRQSPPPVGDQTITARIASRHLEGFPVSDATAARRVATIEFTIAYKART